MVGPVLHQEMMLGSRRSRGYIFRWIYAGWLICEVLVLAISQAGGGFFFGQSRRGPLTPMVGEAFTELFLWQQLILMLLATPVFVAGGITDEKSRGTLQYLLTADLNSWQIVLGKLLGRVTEVAVLVLTGLPLLCFFGVFAGVDLRLLLVVAAITVVPMLAIGAASLLASVWSRQTRDAVLGLFVVGGVGCLALYLLDWLGLGLIDCFSPLWVVNPPATPPPPSLEKRLLLFTLVWGSIAVVSLALAVWRLRPAYLRQLENAGRKKKAHWWRVERAAVGDEAIQWKEQHVEGLAPVTSLKTVPRWLALLLIFLAATAASCFVLWLHRAPGETLGRMIDRALHLEYAQLAGMIVGSGDGFFVQGIAAILLFTMVVGIRCSGAVSGEREKQTWEALLLTPLTAKQLIRGKVWGIMGASYIYLIAYAVPALVLSALPVLVVFAPPSPARPAAGLSDYEPFFWTAMWVAVTWLGMYYMGAAGIWCSVRSKSSWRSLLGTFGLGYVGGICILAVLSPVIFVVAVFVCMVLWMIDSLLNTNNALSGAGVGFFTQYTPALKIAFGIGLAALFWGLAWYFLSDAQKWVADRERTRHWKEEPYYRRPRSRPQREPSRPRYYR